MRRALICLTTLSTLLAAGCSKDVDRAGTKRHIIEGLSGTSLTDDQRQCVGNSIDGFSDNELRSLDSGKADDALTTQFTDAVTACILGTDTTDGSANESTETTVGSDGSTAAPASPCDVLSTEVINRLSNLDVTAGQPASTPNGSGGNDLSCSWYSSAAGYVSVTYNSAFLEPSGFTFAFGDGATQNVTTLYGDGLVGPTGFGEGGRAMIWTSAGALDMVFVGSDNDPSDDVAITMQLAQALGTTPPDTTS